MKIFIFFLLFALISVSCTSEKEKRNVAVLYDFVIKPLAVENVFLNIRIMDDGSVCISENNINYYIEGQIEEKEVKSIKLNKSQLQELNALIAKILRKHDEFELRKGGWMLLIKDKESEHKINIEGTGFIEWVTKRVLVNLRALG